MAYRYPAPSAGMAVGLEIGGQQVAAATSLATAKGYVDAAKAGGYICGLFFHQLVASGAAGDQWNTPDFQDLIDYIIAQDLQFLTFHDLENAADGPITVKKCTA